MSHVRRLEFTRKQTDRTTGVARIGAHGAACDLLELRVVEVVK
jgi:hypothetical protein